VHASTHPGALRRARGTAAAQPPAAGDNDAAALLAALNLEANDDDE